MVKQLDFTAKEAKAKTMTDAELSYAITDCLQCKVDEGYYMDEASVYQQELARRRKI